MPFMGVNTCVSTMTEGGSDVFQHPRCGANLVCCILYALPWLISGVNSVGVSHIFHGTPQIKVHWIKVRWPWWPRHRRLGTTTGPESGIMPAEPLPCRQTKMCWSTIVQAPRQLCAQRNMLLIQTGLNVYREIAGTGDRKVLLVRHMDQ
jgi:hypothetical protein